MEKIYTDYSLDFNLNRIIALYKFKNLGRVGEHPEPDGVSVKVWVDDLGYCGPEIGVFNFIEQIDFTNLKLSKIKSTQSD
jgi:hypothetical protein